MENKELTLEVMEMVNGGSEQENAELKKAILGNSKLAGHWDFYVKKYGAEDLAICYILDDYVGVVGYIRKYAVDNAYMFEGHSITHPDILNMIRNY